MNSGLTRLRDAVEVLGRRHAGRRLEQRPRDAEPHDVEAKRADLREVVARIRLGALVVLALCAWEQRRRGVTERV